jgi:hypothetical protein
MHGRDPDPDGRRPVKALLMPTIAMNASSSRQSDKHKGRGIPRLRRTWKLERAKGFEPSTQPWQAKNYVVAAFPQIAREYETVQVLRRLTSLSADALRRTPADWRKPRRNMKMVTAR